MAKKNFVITIGIASAASLSIFLSGCSETTVSNTANTSNTNRAVIISNANNSMNTNMANNISTANTNNTTNASAAPNANRKPVQAMKEPTPQIGSGADDLLLFTKLRNSLSSDKELQTYVVIEVKEGNVTLSGKAASAEKKAQAEQLIKAVDGVKSVKNNITVSK
jgi:osmotically-inducible protein OsmY